MTSAPPPRRSACDRVPPKARRRLDEIERQAIEAKTRRRVVVVFVFDGEGGLEVELEPPREVYSSGA